VKPDQIEKVLLKVHPLVIELTGKKTPQKGLEGKFSVYHSCAVGFLYGKAGEHEYEDAVVQSPEVIAIRDRVEAIVDENMDEAAADVTVITKDGKTHHVLVEHAIGSLERPMSNEQLKAKFMDQAGAVIGHAAAEEAWTKAMQFGR
jgi:2-methylcitrate dehydratase PrpD